MYDYLIVGSGLFGSVFAYEAKKRGKSVLVVEKRRHIGGNIYTEKIQDIDVHIYGAHIFHTSDKIVWDYMQQFVKFNHYTHSPIACYEGELYNLPFNMNTFSRMWGIKTPAEAQAILAEQREEIKLEPQNLEEQAIALVGRDIYERLVKGYTEKQWGRSATELPASIIKRLPIRMVFDNNYFNDTYQGIPIGGYTQIIERMLEDIEVQLNKDFFENRKELETYAKKIIFTGMIDAYFNYCFGALDYRSLRFEIEILPIDNYQGNAVINYTNYEIPYTRIIEHKHFYFGCQGGNATKNTVITKEYPVSFQRGGEPYYPIHDEHNTKLYARYQALAEQEQNVIFGGRLGLYKYCDMHEVIAEAIICAERELG